MIRPRISARLLRLLIVSQHRFRRWHAWIYVDWANIACGSRTPHEYPLQQQPLRRLGWLLDAVGFHNPNRRFRITLFVREPYEGFNLVDGGEVWPGEGVL